MFLCDAFRRLPEMVTRADAAEALSGTRRGLA